MSDIKRKPKTKRNKREAKNNTTFAPTAYATVKDFKHGSKTARSKRVTGTELVGTVAGSVGFAYSAYDLNPGVAGTFPRLSIEASVWEQYSFRKLRFMYVAACASTSSGSVLLSPDYDASDTEFSQTEASLANTEDAREGMPWSSFNVDLNPGAMHALGPRKYIRGVSMAGDPKTFDVGILHVGTVGQAGTTTIGKLWVEYDVEFYVPSIPAPLQATAVSIFQATVDQTVVLAAAAVRVAFDNAQANPLRILRGGTDIFYLPAGVFLVTAQVGMYRNANGLSNWSLIPYVGGTPLNQRSLMYTNTTVGALAGNSQDFTFMYSSTGLTVPLDIRVNLTGTGAGDGSLFSYCTRLIIRVI